MGKLDEDAARLLEGSKYDGVVIDRAESFECCFFNLEWTRRNSITCFQRFSPSSERNLLIRDEDEMLEPGNEFSSTLLRVDLDLIASSLSVSSKSLEGLNRSKNLDLSSIILQYSSKDFGTIFRSSSISLPRLALSSV
jgi:hypothetical protein